MNYNLTLLKLLSQYLDVSHLKLAQLIFPSVKWVEKRKEIELGTDKP